MIKEISEIASNTEKLIKVFHVKLICELAITFVLGVLLFKLIDIFDKHLNEKLNKENNSPLTRFVPILSNILKGITVFFLVATFMQTHGYSMSSLIAGFGITGLAVGFAAQHTIANIFGTLGILSDHSYNIGDFISVNNNEGTVEEINMRSTKIRALDNSIIILPNDVVAAAVIKNVSSAEKRRIFETFGVTYHTSDEKLKRAVVILEEILKTHDDIYDDFIVYVEKLSSSSIDIKISAYTKTNVYAEFLKIREDIILKTINRYREEGIDFAFPSTSVYLEKN